MYIERNIVSGRNGSKDFDDSDDEKEVEDNYTVWVISKDVNVVTPYTYDEAIALAGHGPYSVGLLVVCSISLMALIVDFFGFSTVVTNCSCELGIGPWQRNILLSMPYLEICAFNLVTWLLVGCIATAYVWGYVCDTRGRRLSLLVGMWGGFITTTLSAFSPNWIVLAVLKFISVSFCSCAQSATYTLIGECCPLSVKRTYFFLLSSALNLGLPFYTALGYASLNMSFSYNLGFLTFTPWRFLVLCLGLPLGISAVGLHALYESPKFLTNIGEKGRALEILREIWKRNRCVGKKYPVEKLILQEEGNAMMKEMPLLQSLWAQTVPLFKRPLLFRTLQLYFLTLVGYGTSNCLLSWFPFLVNAFLSEVPEGMCSIIEHSQNVTNTTDSFSCTPQPNVIVIWASISQGLALFIISILICKVTNRKILVIALTATIAASAIGCGVIEHNIISLVLFLALYLSVVFNGIVAMYFVDLFPTSYRGMVGCLSIVVGRGGGLVATVSVGLSIMTHCSITFYVIAGFILCGMMVACFLPSDRVEKVR